MIMEWFFIPNKELMEVLKWELVMIKKQKNMPANRSIVMICKLWKRDIVCVNGEKQVKIVIFTIFLAFPCFSSIIG
mgnify:CR=1 FL=1